MSAVEDFTVGEQWDHRKEKWHVLISGCYLHASEQDIKLASIIHLRVLGLAYCLHSLRIFMANNVATLSELQQFNLAGQDYHLTNIYKLFAENFIHRDSWQELYSRLCDIPEHGKLGANQLIPYCIEEMTVCIDYYDRLIESNSANISMFDDETVLEQRMTMQQFYKNVLHELNALVVFMKDDDAPNIPDTYEECDEDMMDE